MPDKEFKIIISKELNEMQEDTLFCHRKEGNPVICNLYEQGEYHAK